METLLDALDARHAEEEEALLRRTLVEASWSLRAAARALAGLPGPGATGEESAVGALRSRLRQHPDLAAEIPRRRAAALAEGAAAAKRASR